MKKSQIINCVIIGVILLLAVIDATFKYPGYLEALIEFICLLSSGISIRAFMAPTFDDKSFNNQQSFWIIFLPTFGAITFAFSLFYTSHVYMITSDKNKITEDYKEALQNVIDLSEEYTPYYTYSFIEAFPNYYNYID